MRFMMMFTSDREPDPGVSACKSQLPEMAKLIRYIRIGEPTVMKILAPILIDVPGLHYALAQPVKAKRRAA